MQMARKGENIYKRKDGRWEGRYIKYYGCDKKAKYGYVYGKTYAETKAKLIEKQNSLDVKKEDAKKSIRYEKISTMWLSSIRKNVKESTYSRYSQLVNKHIIPKLGNYYIDRISTPLIELFVNELLNNGRLDGKGGLAPKTVNDILTIVKSILEYSNYIGYVRVAKIQNEFDTVGETQIQFDLEEEFSIETAIVVCEIYKKNGEWKFNAVAAGYQGGLEALCRNYGVNV